MDYVVHKRFRGKDFAGRPINLPFGTHLEMNDLNNIIHHGDRPVCYKKSNVAHTYFARDDDHMGVIRGQLITSIIKTLERRNGESIEDHSKRWEVVWNSSVCRPFKRVEYADEWHWNDEFFNATIDTLKQIAALVGAEKGK